MVRAKKAKTKAELERDEENAVVTAAKAMGVPSLKFTPQGQRGYPDRIFFIPGGRPAFLEFKREGEKPEPLQAYRMAQLRNAGYIAKWYDNRYEAIKFLHRMVSNATKPKKVRASQLPETSH